MHKSVLMALSMSMAMMPGHEVFEIKSRDVNLGYAPTTNKHIAKRQKRKAAKRRAATAKSTKLAHKDRHKKGRP